MGKIIFPLISWLFMAVMLPSYGQRAIPNRQVDKPVENDEENLNVFQQWIRWNNPGSLLINYLNDQAFSCYAKRDLDIASISTPEGWKQRQEYVRSRLKEMFGGIPAAGPVNGQGDRSDKKRRLQD